MDGNMCVATEELFYYVAGHNLLALAECKSIWVYVQSSSLLLRPNWSWS